MKVFLNTCLLFALLHAVASLTCYQCAGQNEACDDPMEIECADDEDICLSASSKISMSNFNLITAYAKSCVQSKDWHTSTYFVATENNIVMAGKVKVCNTDLCNEETTGLPRRNALEENGWKCPACISFESDHCESENTVSCRGNETQCVYLGATIQASEDTDVDFAIRGCGTPTFCILQEGHTDVAGGFITGNVTHLECIDAPMSRSALEGYARRPHHVWNTSIHETEAEGQGPGN